MSIDFEDVTIPDDVSDVAGESTDLACEVCGRPLTYSGKGRKPKFCDEHKRGTSSASTGNATVRRSNKDVESALATMDNIYDLLFFGFGMVSETAASMWLPRRAQLQQQNRQLFISDPGLCRRVNALGAKGGTGAFIGAHAMALFPIAVVLNAEVQARGAARRKLAEERRAAQAAASGETNDPGDFGPGAAYMP